MRKLLTTAALLAFLPSASIAEPTVGFGLTFKFGNDGADPGLALRLFSDNRQNRLAGTAGLDFLFRSMRFRPTLGASFVGEDVFFGVDFGLGNGFSSGGINVGISGGYVNTFGPPAPIVAPAATPPAVTPVVTPTVVTPVVETPTVVTPPVVTPPVVTPPIETPPARETPPRNAAFLEEENMDIIIGGETDFA